MKPVFILFSACILFSCKKALIQPTVTETVSVPWPDSSNSHPKNAVFIALLEKYTRLGLPGISLLIDDANGTWVGSAGKADLENNIAFQAGQVSKAASITKIFMGTLVFKMIEDSANTGMGYASLHRPLSSWLPQKIISRLANGNKITLGDCMKHETGIPDLIGEDAFYLAALNQPNKRWKAEELLSFVYDKDPLFAPNDTAIYSNTNTILVSMVLEAATGKNHNSLLHHYILDPLQMHHSRYHTHDALPPVVAQGYYDLYNNNKLVNVSNIITGSGNGYGGLYSNVFDLFTFSRALLIQKTFLSSRSFQMMETYGKTDENNRYGYGIMKKFIERGADAGIGHAGRDLGYTANMFYFPNKKVLHIFFINYGTDSKTNLRQVFYDFQAELLTVSLK